MNNHWNKGINIKAMLIDMKPKHVLEIGCLEGENTENLKSIMSDVGYKLTCISDDLEMKDDGVTRIRGISYNEIPKLKDNSIDFVLLDTDHNYLTLERELLALHPKLTVGAIIVIHDVEYFYYNTGIAVAKETGDTYGELSEYPLNEIRDCASKFGGMALAVIDWLHNNRYHYQLKSWISDGIGVCVIRKNPSTLQVLTIAPASVGKANRSGSREFAKV